jgi:hypothetical protein
VQRPEFWQTFRKTRQRAPTIKIRRSGGAPRAKGTLALGKGKNKTSNWKEKKK